ncbi:Crp/Fnr family transcriptional regulator [Paeniroseomonas aquatica]|uniref:Crp/Fnr family transcriptional regulator n=1 Tax=Paeniroseomonas aquatica TaxID=373043 RepID=A0ABT8ABL9_9PROT|nr:Crp/Fnr family transcriptional regulator [Paeniroseomonas aquatica]MDN3567139.1 Crp/Fnr family transcriptional regulator [Paeniroseomonas aquatica]
MALAESHRDAVLAAHPLLRHLRPEDLRRLAATAQIMRHPRHATIFQKGDPGASMMAIIRGRVKICTFSNDGRELVLNILDQGGMFGEIALLDGRPRTADAVALEETELFVIERAQFLPFLTSNPEALARLLTVLCQRLRQTSETLEDALLREAPSRLARGLLRLADTFGRPTPGGTRLTIKLSQQQIGSLIGASRESINKHLGDWTRAGHLGTEEGCLVLRDRALLQRIAEAEA